MSKALEDMTKAELIVAYRNLETKFSGLEHELEKIKSLVFGSKSEKYKTEDSDSSSEDKTQMVTYERKASNTKKKKSGRLPLPEHLVRKELIIEPEEPTEGCTKIGQEETEVLAYQPASLYVIKYIRPKYAKPDGDGILIGKLPGRTIEKGSVDASLLAQILIDKFTDHIPVYRQIKRYKREGVVLSPSTVNGWQEQVFRILEPLYDRLTELVLEKGYLQADETPIQVLDSNKKGSTHQGYYWVYHTPEDDLVFFDYQQGRGQDGPNGILTNFQGYLQTDGYKVYHAFGKKEGITLIHCWAHARRKFHEALKYDPERAEFMMQKIQQLYALERKILEENKQKPPEVLNENRHHTRKEDATPILEEIKTYIEKQQPNVLPKSPIGEAFTYTQNLWNGLMGYTLDGKLLMDNNLVENAIRPNALGRKNYLFAGSHHGAKRAAMFYSLMGCCEKHNIQPFKWLNDILNRINDHPIQKIDQLLPHNWKKSTATES